MKFLKKKNNKIKSAIFIFLLFLSKKTFANGLVPCDGVDIPCDFTQIIQLINNLIEFILLMILPISAIMFAYAGFLLMTQGSKSGSRDKAKQIFINVGIGIVLVLGAWLIVATILNTLGVPDAYSWLDLAGMR